MFIVFLVMLPIYGYATLSVFHAMIDKRLDILHGICALFGILLIMTIAIQSNSLAVAGGLAVTSMAFGAMLPYARSQMRHAEFRDINRSEIERLYARLAEDPQNPLSAFALSEALYMHGYRGAAIRLSERTLEAIDATPDPMTGRSRRNIYDNEARRMREWIRRSCAEDFAPIPCGNCGTPCPPESLNCTHCGRAAMLERMRRETSSTGTLGRLLFALIMVTAFIAITGYASTFANLTPLFFVVMLGTIGGTMWWLFRPQKHDQTVPIYTYDD